MDVRVVVVVISYFLLSCYSLLFECREIGSHEYYDRAEMVAKRVVSFLFGPFIITIAIVSSVLETILRMLQGKKERW